MEIRFANENDDKKILASLIYHVDPYIYPYWFNNCKETGVKELEKLINFYYKNCIIAEEDAKLVGIFSFIPANAKPSRDYSKYDFTFESHHVIQYYIIDVINNLVPDDACVVGLYVDPAYRRRGIATKMFEFLFDNVKAKTFSLEVLADNYPALSLYKNLSFNITKTYRGYNGYRRKKPLCHIMAR